MTTNELKELLKSGETTTIQFKRQISNTVSLAEEMVAMANTDGGLIIVGVEEDKSGQAHIFGIENTKDINNHISNASSEICVPQIFVKTETLIIEEKLILIINVLKGTQKPYRTKSGKYLMRTGADKRAMSSEEIIRLQTSNQSYLTEELPVFGSNTDSDINKSSFYIFFERQHETSVIEHLDAHKINLTKLLNNLKLAYESHLNLVGLMFFGRQPQRLKPMFIVKAVHFYGTNIAESEYISNEDIDGSLDIQFQRSLIFVSSNLLKKQKNQSFNSIGIQEIHQEALQEAIINALIHRDYSILSTIQILIFADRVEIISPGSLVNHLTIENIIHSTAIARNPIMLSYAAKILPYKGLGSGIPRILKLHPKTDLINDREKHQFKVIMWR
jgi:predicted HTH transcriptional regulator